MRTSSCEAPGVRSALVTGGLGFLGRHVVDRLIDGGYLVHVIDNLSPRGPGDDRRREEAAALLARWPSRQVTHDIISVADYARGVDHQAARRRRWGRIDEIYHLASIVGPVGVLSCAGKIAREVVEDACLMAELATETGARMCYASTSEVYGGGRGGACAEDDPRVVPARASARDEYGAAKVAAEVALASLSRASGLPASIVRPFNVAGPEQHAAGGFVLPRFVDQALRGIPVTVYGAGDAVRALTHVADVADGVILAARRGRPGAAYNLGRAENRTTILELARLVIRVTGSSSIIAHVDPRLLHGDLFEEVGDKYPEGDLASRELGWRPTRDLETIVRDTVASTPRAEASPAR